MQRSVFDGETLRLQQVQVHIDHCWAEERYISQCITAAAQTALPPAQLVLWRRSWTPTRWSMASWAWVGKSSSKTSGIQYQFLHFEIIRLVKKAMYDQFPSSWKPVGVVQVPTYTKEVPLLTLGRLRRPGQGAQPRQAFARGLTGEEEEEEISEEEGVAASGATSPSILTSSQFFSKNICSFFVMHLFLDYIYLMYFLAANSL